MTPSDYADWLGRARRHVRTDADAADLLHDALLIAAQAGRADLSGEADHRWLSGVLRNRAAELYRSSTRRVAREHASASAPLVEAAEPVLPPRLEAMPRSARTVLALALHGLTRPEIASALRITDAALRQRLATLRRTLDPAGAPALRALARVQQAQRAGPAARHLRNRLIAHARQAAALATHDADGHALAFAQKETAPAHKPAPGGNE